MCDFFSFITFNNNPVLNYGLLIKINLGDKLRIILYSTVSDKNIDSLFVGGGDILSDVIIS